MGVQAPQGDQVLERQDGDPRRCRRVVPADLQGEEPDLGLVLRRDRRRERVSEDAGDLHAQGRRDRQRPGQHGHDQPRRSRLGVQVPDRRPACVHRPRGLPAEGRRHQAAPRHGRVLLLVVRPEQAARAEAQPLLQAVVEGSAARGLSGRDHPVVRPVGGGADHRGRERPGRLVVRQRARRPPPRDGDEVPEPGAHQPPDGVLVRADERQPAAVQQPQGATGGELRDRPQRRSEDLRRAEARVAVVSGAPARLPGAQGLLPVHEESGHHLVGARPREGEGTRQGIRNRRPEGRGRDGRTTR